MEKVKKKKINIHVCILRMFSALGWLIIAYSFYILDKATPDKYFDRKLKTLPPTQWNLELLDQFMMLMILVLAVSAVGCLVNAVEHRNRKMFYRVNLIVLVLMGIFGIAFYYTLI